MSDSTHAVFARSDFDPNEYANAILAGEPFPPPSVPRPKIPPAETITLEPAKEDISVAISKLNFGIEDVSKQLKNVVTAHHEALLVQAAGVNQLEVSLTNVRSGLNEITASLEKLRLKIRVPYKTLEQHVARLERLQLASDVLRRTGRFILVARRLEQQMRDSQRSSETPNEHDQTSSTPTEKASNRVKGSAAVPDDPALGNEGEKDRAIAKAALSIAELASLLDASGDAPIEGTPRAGDTEDPSAISLRALHVVSAHIPAIDNAREVVTTEMENMVLTGLSTVNQALLASSLQTAHNLSVLPTLVESLVADLSDAVESRIRAAFDMARVGRDVGAKDPNVASQGLLYKSRVRNEPTSVTAPQWTAAIWARFENLMEEMVGCCAKVYTLEKVLVLKKDMISQRSFLDEAMKVLENKPSVTFWTVMARALEKQCRDAAKGSTFLQQTLTTGYPRLLRLFHEFFIKVAVHTDSVYTQEKQSPETILILRALSNLETLYLSRSANRLNEAVAQALANGARAPPAMGEGLGIARIASNELDAAKFDPLLVLGVARNVQVGLELMLTRIDPLIVRDRWATSLLGPVSTPQQTQNAQLATCLYHVWVELDKLKSEYPEAVMDILRPTIKDLHTTFETIVHPLLASIRRELSAIIARLHRLDLGRGLDASTGLGGTSTYMKDLADKLTFIKSEVIAKFNVGEASRGWITKIVKDVLTTFVLHASIAKPLGESGKLQLTTDMTELEFALSAFMAEGSQSKHGARLEAIGDEYRALRAMRPLLFLENCMLSEPEKTTGLPPLVVLHHILVRSPIPLPHTLHGWQETEYVHWVAEHTDEEALTLIEGGLAHWESNPTMNPDMASSREYVDLAHIVLTHVKTIERN
ncbi:hypothetical protein BD410DRAFT_784062 [Rickenella mellea]|uniref:Conserved oligomeric Golgi complex subunit 5 n=1 Tax=Rickenella mellea TaxID=50990 RepID=A0A4Y7QGR3_9AGAM|nr:hypothetical protein BD410DRAFT_784062 [Rickenella mellea]